VLVSVYKLSLTWLKVSEISAELISASPAHRRFILRK
jgi:hypothetical protein